MNNLFIDTAGIAGEDLTTEILRIILIKDEFAPFQKLFYNCFLGKRELKTTKEFLFEIGTQNTFKIQGRPDLLIYNNDEAYCIENKFYAHFSTENQLFRYYEILKSDDRFRDCKLKKVYLLTIKRRGHYYKSLINTLLLHSDKYRNNGINKFGDLFGIIYWEDILDLWKSDDFLITALRDYIYELYIKDIKFEKEDIMHVKNKDIPKFIEKLYQLTKKVREELVNRRFITSSVSSSYQWSGFYVNLESIQIWIGFGLDFWIIESFSSPFGLQIQSNRVADSIKDQLDAKLEKLPGFVLHKHLFWIKSYEINLIENYIGLLCNLIENDLRELNKIFKDLGNKYSI